MDLDFTPEQEMLARTLRQLCTAHLGSVRLRELETDASGHDLPLWRALMDAGIGGVLIDEAHGGSGLGLLECAIVAEELGRALAPTPLLPSCLQAARLLALLGNAAQRAQWLPRIAHGDVLVPAWREPGTSPAIDACACTATPQAGGFRLDGTKILVPFANVATAFLVAAAGVDGPGLFLVPADAPGIALAAQPNHAQQSLWQLRFDGVDLAADARLGGADCVPAWEQVIGELQLARAAESIGGAARMLEMATAHARERQQFGQPIGSFQAIAHPLADSATEIAGTRFLVFQAAWAHDSGRDFLALAQMAKLQAGAVFRRAATRGVQVHGGLGFSLEADPQLYYRRAKHLQLMDGDAAWLERRIAAGVLD